MARRMRHHLCFAVAQLARAASFRFIDEVTSGLVTRGFLRLSASSFNWRANPSALRLGRETKSAARMTKGGSAGRNGRATKDAGNESTTPSVSTEAPLSAIILAKREATPSDVCETSAGTTPYGFKIAL